MRHLGSLTVTTPTDREIAMTRLFDAPRSLVFEAFIRPELIRRWLLGPPGWTMVVCEFDARPGGLYRYVWHKDDGTVMGMGGVVQEVVPPERLVATEKFDHAWYPGEAIDTTTFVEDGPTTIVSITVLYESKETRDAVLKTPMAEGMVAGYDRLAELLTTLVEKA